MRMTHKLIVARLVPPEVLTYAGTRRDNIDLAAAFVGAALRRAPFYIRLPEIAFRYVSFAFFIVLLVTPIGPARKHNFCVFLFRLTRASGSLLRLYQSLAFFALFESPLFTQKLGLVSQVDKQDHFRKIFARHNGVSA